MGFPGSSAVKASACNAGDLGLIPGLGRSPGEGLGYPLQYSWADGSPPDSPVPGILQARTLEWVAISFSIQAADLGEHRSPQSGRLSLLATHLPPCRQEPQKLVVSKALKLPSHPGCQQTLSTVPCATQYSRGLCRGAAGNPRVPRLLPGTLGSFPGCL